MCLHKLATICWMESFDCSKYTFQWVNLMIITGEHTIVDMLLSESIANPCSVPCCCNTHNFLRCANDRQTSLLCTGPFFLRSCSRVHMLSMHFKDPPRLLISIVHLRTQTIIYFLEPLELFLAIGALPLQATVQVMTSPANSTHHAWTISFPNTSGSLRTLNCAVNIQFTKR